MPDAIQPSLRPLFEDARRRLVEIGTRNRLVHVNRANTRGHVVNIVNERSDDVYGILSNGKAMRFRAIEQNNGHDEDEIVLADEDTEEFDTSRYSDALLETRIGPDALQKRLLKIAREARTAEEEQGVNVLYLALGFLTWFEEKDSAVSREAPLVLLPVELIRNARTSTYDVKLRDEDLVTNLPLQQRLKNDFGIKLPDLDASAEDWLPSNYFDLVQAVVSERNSWKIDRDGMQLGFFSFSKLLMYLDLDIEAWPEKSIESHSLVRGLLCEGFESEPPLFGPETKLDEVLPPERLFHVVDADASQTKVIEEVRSGRNLVVQGPPGTGKSQTITNIIAAAAQEGKTVLFVAEKMAALSVVHDRLVKHGLGDICLELHSKNVNKKSVYGELARTLAAGQAVPAMAAHPAELTAARDKLNAIAEILHAPVPGCDESAFSALANQGRHIGRGAPPPQLRRNGLAEIRRDDAAELVNAISQYGRLAEHADPTTHPFRGVTALELQPVELQRLKTSLAAAAAAIRELSEAIGEAAEAFGVTADDRATWTTQVTDLLQRLEGMPEADEGALIAIVNLSDKTRLKNGLVAGQAWRDRRDGLGTVFLEVAFDAEVSALRGAIAAGCDSFFARWGSAYRTASRQLRGYLVGRLPKSAAERLDLVDAILDVQSLRARFAEYETFCSASVGGAWRGERTDFPLISSAVDWAERVAGSKIQISAERAVSLAGKPDELTDLKQQLNSAYSAAVQHLGDIVGALGIPALVELELTESSARLQEMADQVERYGEWSQLARTRERLVKCDLQELADRIDSGELNSETAVVEFDFARAECIWKRALETSAVLRELRDLNRHELVELFANLERTRLNENARTIIAKHLSQLPQGAMGEMRVIRGEIAKRRRHMAVRRLFSLAPAALQRIKPVLLMSPISVAQFLTPGKIQFDLLVIDEASQVRPEDALGAIARAVQIVVVGDAKQLPPTSFFDRLLADDTADTADEQAEEAAELLGHSASAGEMESILTLCEAKGLGSRMLEWHYRSRDPSLIRVSNREFYDNRLVLPPSPLQGHAAYGLCFTRVNGVYDRGGRRDNRIEGEAVVRRTVEHAKTHPDLSLGIVTFSSAQRDLITELLELERRGDEALDEFLREGSAEDAFVKNIENVQGDERDVILISVGYGPATPGGRLASMSFGPVNAEGGERRLNVLFTRARVRCEVFASFDPADIDTSRTIREGPRILKRFLDFAKSGSILDATITGEAAETPFEEDVAEVIQGLGYIADPQVGSAGFRIDLGVRHPDKPGLYILAVECDGAAYHGALWARERDRLRQDVLEHLGWRFHRIWSTDWFYNRAREIERLRQALATARERAEAGISVKGANADRVASVLTTDAVLPMPEPIFSERKMPPYRRFSERVHSYNEPHEVSRATLAELAKRIIDFEGPIHVEEIARRIAASYGKEKAGSRIVTATREALRRLHSCSEIRSEDHFWFTAEQANKPPVRDRSDETGATLKAANISLVEICAALELAREDCGDASDDELIRTAARLLGFRRVGSELQARLRHGLVNCNGLR